MLRVSRLTIFLVSALAVSSVLAADASARQFIHEGMAEGDVLVKIGKPDSASDDIGGGARVTEKRWIYLPAHGDNRTMTTLVLCNGKTLEVHRQVTQ
jgi:hypothetical protein